MRFKDYSNDRIVFPEKKISISPEVETEAYPKKLIINALPSHPYDYPQLYVLLDRIKDKPSILSIVKDRYKIDDIILVLSKKKKSEIIQSTISFTGNLKIFYKNSVYPVTDKKLYSMTGVKDFSIMGWYHFYSLLSTEQNLPLEGIPVSISYPSLKKRMHMMVPKSTTVAEMAKIAGIQWDDSTMCTDHPFRGVPISPETKVEKLQPYSFIFFPKNVRKNASLGLKIKYMIWGSYNFSFSDTYDSRPLQLDTPCQKCLYCTKICPVNLAPLMLSALYTAESIKEAKNHSPEQCIECGLCSYICPSNIPLLHNIKRLKKEIGVST